MRQIYKMCFIAFFSLLIFTSSAFEVNAVSKFLCGENENNWQKVRHVPQSSGGWHPVNDNLMGTAAYGNPNNDDEPWSVKWNLADFDEFLFASGNMKYWMRATKNDIIGNDGLKLYANEDIKIISSSRSCLPYTAKMYKRNIYDEDPWLSLRDHSDSPNDVMYGENRNIFHNNVRDHNGGMDVYIRKQFENGSLIKARNKLRELAGETISHMKDVKNSIAELDDDEHDERAFLASLLNELKSSKTILKKAFVEYISTIEKLNVQDSNAFFNEEIELIFDWAFYHQTVLENIDSYPVEYLKKYAPIRTIFNDGLVHLQKKTQEFLDRGELLIRLE